MPKTKRGGAPKDIEPGTYTAVVENVRKVRNKPVYRMTLRTLEDLKLVDNLRVGVDDAAQ